MKLKQFRLRLITTTALTITVAACAVAPATTTAPASTSTAVRPPVTSPPPPLDDPVGTPVLPDLIPAPPVEFNTRNEDGRAILRFSSILANVGDGDFHLRASRPSGDWSVHQVITYSDAGGELREVGAELIWGGDGHNHWHIARVALYWIVALDAAGNPDSDDRSRSDSKVGFCFFDHLRELDHGPEERVFSVHDCGHENDLYIFMGMSPGWSDKYRWELPGQQIDVTDLPDGKYRMWAEADPDRLFIEVTRDNNRNWVDFELRTRQDGLRSALVLDSGPEPSDQRR
jgi:hypothetical protein